MKNKRTSKWERRGLYIAICCCAAIIAAVGYVGNKNETKNNQLNEVAQLGEDSGYTTEYISDEIMFAETDATAEIIVEEKDVVKSEKRGDKKSDVIKDTDNSKIKQDEEVKKEAKFSMPVEGKVICEYSGDKLIYNEILSDWRTHNGIDISCDENAAIYCSMSGVVSDIYDDVLGRNVVIDHKNGYKTVYANLSDEIEVGVGNEIKVGDLIGKIGNNALADFSKEPHLHFEIVYNEEYVNPVDCIE